MIEIEPGWRELLTRIRDGSETHDIMIVGPSDVGKTTLCRFLGEELARRHRTARIDCDPGQSVIGPPTCLGLGWEPWDADEPLALRFVGSKTPARHFMQMLTGVKRLDERADESGVERLIFDLPGYIDSDAGREFQFQLIDLIQPHHLIALQEDRMLEPLLRPFERRTRPAIHRPGISDAVVKRSSPKRISYRTQKFAQYFAEADQRELSAADVGFHGRIPRFDKPDQYINQLVGLCDRSGFAVSVGIVEEIDRDRGLITLFCPPFDPNEVASLHFGSLHVDQSGEET